MTNEELIAKIKTEIERIKESYDVYLARITKEDVLNELDNFLYFLDTLESEKPMQDGLEEEIDKEIDRLWAIKRDNSGQISNGLSEWKGKDQLMNIPAIRHFARHFAQWGAKHAKIDVTDFCKPIEPSIAQCIADHSWEMLGEDEKPVPNDLEEAAEEYADCNSRRWQEDGDIYYDHPKIVAAFIAGAKWDRSQMLKEAVEGDVMLTLHDKTGDVSLHTGYLPKELGIKCDDKVKIIIVKE